MHKKYKDELAPKSIDLGRFFEINLSLLCIVSLDGYFIKVNRAWEEAFGYLATELEGAYILDFIHPKDRKKSFKLKARLEDNQQPSEIVIRQKHKDGSYRYVELRAKIYEGLIYVAARDITKRKLVEEALGKNEERFRYALKGTRAGLWDWDLKNDHVYFSIPWKGMLGYEEGEIDNTRQGWENLWHPEDVPRIEQAINDYLSGKSAVYEISYRLRHKTGGWRWVLARGEIIKDSSGIPYRFIGTNIDITHLKDAEEEIRYLSFHDQLTGLYNRRFYEEELKRLETKRNLPLSIIMADVNCLKLVNDSFGHLVGDKLLQRFAEILKQECRADEILARLGGDEFVILMPKTDSKGAKALVKRITNALAKEKMDLFDVSASLGWATKVYLFEDMEDIFKNAEDRMYQQKLQMSPRIKAKTIQAIFSAMTDKFPGEKEHAQRVSALCEALGRHLHFDQVELNEIAKAGLLHDIGKITMSEGVLNKPRKLNKSEWTEIKRHSETGFRILGSVSELAQLAKYVHHHHERWDGKGYPNGLKGQEIPLQSRIISIADAYDVMTTKRSYRKTLSKEEAIDEIAKNAGVQFDPDMARLFIEKVLEQN